MPKGYDPLIASGPPDDFARNQVGLSWTEEDTQRMLEMENNAIAVETDIKPTDVWYFEVEDEK